MREWFDGLEQRDRIVLAAGAVAVVLIVAWVFIWTPLRSGAAELDDTVAEKHEMLATLQRAQALGGPAPSAAAATQSLVLIVDQTHRAHGLTGTLSRNQPDGTDGIRVTFQAASFDSLVTWLVALQRSYGVAVESANFDGTREAGLVGATLVLRRS
ncbi:MAG: type II secretion system protein GspM [Gammaproteobacteria bacterium]